MVQLFLKQSTELDVIYRCLFTAFSFERVNKNNWLLGGGRAGSKRVNESKCIKSAEIHRTISEFGAMLWV
ncbi:hypothetical protein AM274_30485 [Pseudomonas nunensis]|nr:hypothetical protein AM274_30485 [Pseudomonas nunensis]